MIRIDVVSDVICPWCFLGKRRLDKALASLPELETEVSFRPFFLDPTIPVDGLDREKYMKDKFGNRDLKAMHKPLEDAGAKDGVPYQFDKITRTPNTMDAHRLIRWAKQAGKQMEVVEALFCAYWRDGRDVGDVAVLVDVAKSQGMDGAEVERLLKSNKDAAEVMAEVQQAYNIGVQGVPTFIINQKYGISGAQDVAVLADSIRRAAAEA
ncbi:DsbA family oxidoreductase [Aestuariivirga litoralis]|uniref:DsbA family oxidoreductase n=1 Tax=Aestuariivirga litoralis TaxID=2650924 RepID=UPI001FEDD94C|nr:DsbA family oxidoreductase [Aestuariivirga litoralis]